MHEQSLYLSVKFRKGKKLWYKLSVADFPSSCDASIAKGKYGLKGDFFLNIQVNQKKSLKMSLEEISNMRLINQKISKTEFRSAKEIVSWMGAMQAQDYSMCKLATAIRLMNSTTSALESALNNGEILRTHIMRPTWHLVAAEDIYWMLELTAPQIRKILNTNDKRFELTDQIYAKTNTVLENVLSNNCSMTRE